METEVGEQNAPKMYRLSLSLTMDDFLHDLTLYAQQFSEIREIYLLWFSIKSGLTNF